jgi:hypothetical protein
MAARARVRSLYRSLRQIPKLVDTSEVFSPLKSASTACSRCSAGERPWNDGIIIEVPRQPQKVYNPISQKT